MKPTGLLSLLLILSLFTYSLPTRAANESARQIITPAVLMGTEERAEIVSVADWHIECVDCPYRIDSLSNRGLALDSAGHPHIIYGGDRLFYAWYDGADWQYEIIIPLLSSAATLVLDKADQPHVAYYDSSQAALRYAYWDGLAWVDQTVDTSGVLGSSASLALDGDDQPRISYSAADGLRYAHWTGSSWEIEQVVTDTVSTTSLALDEAGSPHISFASGPAYDMQINYARWTGSAWEVQTVEGGEYHTIGMNALALDTAGGPHISYYDYYGTAIHVDSLKYAHLIEDNWEIQMLDTGYRVGSTNSLVLDSQDHPHLSYQGPNGLVYTYWSGSEWVKDLIPEVIYSAALALDVADQAHIAFLNDPDRTLVYTYQTAVGWERQVVDQGSADVGADTSIAIDKAGGRHISYLDRTHDLLKYAYSAGADWEIQTVAAAAEAGESALAVDAAGIPHLAFLGFGDPNSLYYASWSGAAWQVQEIAQGVGNFSLALDSDGQPHLSYYAEAGGGLMYTHWDGLAWVSQMVDAGGFVGYYNSLAVDSISNPQIAYFDWDNYTLKLAHWTGIEWDIQVVTTAWNYPLDLALDSADHPHIVYKNADLMVAHWSGSAWETQFVDLSLDYIQDVSIAIDGADRPHLAYRYTDGASDEADLRYAIRTGTHWEIQTIDSQGDVGDDVALALDAVGCAHISYYDATNGDLKTARLLPALRLVKTALPHAGILPGQLFTYTLTLSGPGLVASLYDPLPESVVYLTGSLTASAVYDPLAHAVLWQGVLPTDTIQTVCFQVASVLPGAVGLPLIANTAWLTDTSYSRSVSATAVVNGWEIFNPLLRR